MSHIKKISIILIALALLLSPVAALAQPALASSGAASDAASGAVRVYAKTVVEDKSVTINGVNLVANTRYTIYLSKTKTYSDKSVLVGSAMTDAKGAFSKTYRIPGRLVDVARVYIYITNGKHDTASNWFINASASGNTGGEGTSNFNFSVVSVKRDTTVKIKTANLPANVTFIVYIGKSGSKGVNGVKVGTLVHDDGGSIRFTFNIPDSLEGKSKLDIRIENKQLGIAVYQTFDN